MKTWSFADAQTGLFTGATFSASGHLGTIAGNTRPGCIAVEGSFDHLTQRLDLESGRVIDDPDLAARSAQIQERGQRRASALAQIAALEQRQLRPLRELARDPANREARLKIDTIDIDIAKLREQLRE